LTRGVNLRYPAAPVKAIKGRKALRLSSPTGRKLMYMFDLMLDHFGPQHWWPGETELEIMVGAILTQNTNWNNVERAIYKLKKDNLLSMKALHSISQEELAKKIRPAGYYNIKAGRLKNLIKSLTERYEGNIDNFLNEETLELREFLLSVKGVGPETADSIILYAANRPLFVIDAYTYRILNRHNMVDDSMTYDELQGLFMDNLPEDYELYNEFHALIVRTGKEYCGRRAKCDICPLQEWEYDINKYINV
jgi:endonuclease-3 related protein